MFLTSCSNTFYMGPVMCDYCSMTRIKRIGDLTDKMPGEYCKEILKL